MAEAQELIANGIQFPVDRNGFCLAVIGSLNLDPSGKFTLEPQAITHTNFNANQTRALDVNVAGGNIHLDPGDIEIGAVEIKDSATDTRVKVGSDGVQNALYVQARFLDIPLSALQGTSTHILFGTASAVPTGVETAIFSFIVPSGQTLYIRHAFFSGETPAKYRLVIGAATKGVYRTYFTDYNGRMVFEQGIDKGIPALTGETVQLFVRHSRPGASDFEGTLCGRLE